MLQAKPLCVKEDVHRTYQAPMHISKFASRMLTTQNQRSHFRILNLPLLLWADLNQEKLFDRDSYVEKFYYNQITHKPNGFCYTFWLYTWFATTLTAYYDVNKYIGTLSSSGFAELKTSDFSRSNSLSFAFKSSLFSCTWKKKKGCETKLWQKCLDYTQAST